MNYKRENQVKSGAVGGPATARGMNYQIDYTIRVALELISKSCSAPLKRWILRLEPRVIDLFGVTSWDLGIDPTDHQIEIKINPTAGEILEWIKDVRQATNSDSQRRFRLVYGSRSTLRLARVDQLIRIANEADGNKEKFDSILALEKIKDAGVICGLLGDDAFQILRQMELRSISEEDLKENIEERARLLAGPSGGERLRLLLFDKFQHAARNRPSFAIDSLIEEIRAQGIQLQPPPEVAISEFGPLASAALFILQACETPLPVVATAAACASSASEVESALGDALDAGIVTRENGLWALNPLTSPLTHPNGDDLLAKGLTSLLSFIENHQQYEVAFGQARNAIALARKCGASQPNAVAPVFMKIDRFLKRRGDKHLILEVAEMSVNAARRAQRTTDMVEAEARALVCGVSWVLQRLPGHLHEAKAAYDLSRELARKINSDASLAYSAKCLGRYHRIVAEDDLDKRMDELRLSEDRLHEAIQRFSVLAAYGPEHLEVGDCLSLLGRTYLVGKKYAKAREVVTQAYPLLADTNSKEFLDLLILIGELHMRRDAKAALSYFTEAIELRLDLDLSVTEMRARAFRQRGLAYSQLDRKGEAATDFRESIEIWTELNEVAAAAQAKWDLFYLEKRLSVADFQFLEQYAPTIRVNAIEIHLTKLTSQHKPHLGRRLQPDRRYWEQLVKEAEKQDALNNIEW
jgi:tetratricopeptide (TPR) repeat protein